jgi:hypothetical protein
MEISTIEKALLQIVAKRQELKKLDYNDPAYDTMEDALHDLEDAFQDSFGEFLEDILQDVHDDICPDTDVLLPIAYLAGNYTADEKGQLQVAAGEGIYVETDEYPGKDTKLVIVPSPLRIVMNFGNGKQEVVWTPDKA